MQIQRNGRFLLSSLKRLGNLNWIRYDDGLSFRASRDTNVLMESWCGPFNTHRIQPITSPRFFQFRLYRFQNFLLVVADASDFYYRSDLKRWSVTGRRACFFTGKRSLWLGAQRGSGPSNASVCLRRCAGMKLWILIALTVRRLLDANMETSNWPKLIKCSALPSWTGLSTDSC